MAFTLGKLRAAVVTGAVLVLAVVAGVVWYGARQASRFHFKLPKRLGVNIKQEMNGFTYSQSSKGRTVFTVHASTYVQENNGIVTLHDASIVLYGRGDGQADKIRGQQFEFDQAHGVLTAVGVVFLDLASPAPKDASAKPAADAESRVIHVKTSGLVFNQSAQTAATPERIDWTAQGMTGDAIGADYNAKTGEVVMRSAIHVSGLRNDRPVVLTAAHADMQRVASAEGSSAPSVLLLEQARYVSVGLRGSQTVAGDHAVVHLTKDGSPEALESQGHVAIAESGRGTMTGDRLEVQMNASGQPRAAHLFGGVRFVSEPQAPTQTQGTASDLRLAFDAKGNPQHAVLTGQVQGQEQAGTVHRALSADHVELAMTEVVKGKVVLQTGEATGSAVLRLLDQAAAGRTMTEVRGDDLKARFVPVPPAAGQAPAHSSGGVRVSTLNGQGHTVLERTGPDGADDISRSDTLDASFRPVAPKAAGGKAGGSLDAIEQATQRGAVSMVRTVPTAAKPASANSKASAGPIVQHGTAEVAVYDGEADRVTLTGGVQLRDAADLLLADRVVLDHATGDATADGAVRTTYVSADGTGEPLHVLSVRAVEHKEAGTADFFGMAGHDARMWQGLSQVEAPELSFDRIKRTLVAHGEGDSAVVRTVLVNENASSPPPAGTEKKPGGGSGGPVTVLSQKMTYTDGSGEVVFDGRVRAVDRDGRLDAHTVTAYLTKTPATPASQPATPPATVGGFPAGRVERMVAVGDVAVDQPGRHATGERLVYTAADQTFVMTGSKAVPPRMVDEAQGTVTGASLRFRSGDNSVLVSGIGAEGTGDGRVRSDTKVKK